MGKSKNRKDHKKKSRQRTLKIVATKKKAQKEFIDNLNKLQEDMQKKNLEEQKKNIVQTDEIGDIGEIDKVE